MFSDPPWQTECSLFKRNFLNRWTWASLPWQPGCICPQAHHVSLCQAPGGSQTWGTTFYIFLHCIVSSPFAPSHLPGRSIHGEKLFGPFESSSPESEQPMSKGSCPPSSRPGQSSLTLTLCVYFGNVLGSRYAQSSPHPKKHSSQRKLLGFQHSSWCSWTLWNWNVYCWKIDKKRSQTFVPKGSHLTDRRSVLELYSLLPRWSPPGSEWSQTWPLAGPEDRSATRGCLRQSWNNVDFSPVLHPLVGLWVLVADDERPEKECSICLSIKLCPNAQLFLVIVDLLPLLRCHLHHLFRVTFIKLIQLIQNTSSPLTCLIIWARTCDSSNVESLKLPTLGQSLNHTFNVFCWLLLPELEVQGTVPLAYDCLLWEHHGVFPENNWDIQTLY